MGFDAADWANIIIPHILSGVKHVSCPSRADVVSSC
jgi:hypothetical protein